jgi:3-oxoacyl-(acyl-carrier-protein) synthase
MKQSGLFGACLGEMGAVVLGTCSGGMLSIERHYRGLEQGESDLSEAEYYAKKYWTTARLLADSFFLGGPCLTVVTACAAGSGA